MYLVRKHFWSIDLSYTILQFGIAFFKGGVHLEKIASKGRKTESSISKMIFVSLTLHEF